MLRLTAETNSRPVKRMNLQDVDTVAPFPRSLSTGWLRMTSSVQDGGVCNSYTLASFLDGRRKWTRITHLYLPSMGWTKPPRAVGKTSWCHNEQNSTTPISYRNSKAHAGVNKIRDGWIQFGHSGYYAGIMHNVSWLTKHVNTISNSTAFPY